MKIKIILSVLLKIFSKCYTESFMTESFLSQNNYRNRFEKEKFKRCLKL